MSNQQPDYDVAIIGGGPAGMAAALTIKHHGASVVLLDENLSPGGQIYRAVDSDIVSDPNIIGEDYYRGRKLVTDFKNSDIETLSGAAVWNISVEGEIFYTTAGTVKALRADKIILATGAQERPFPVPGWTLPGVMTVGSAQILLKSSGLVSPNAVFAGTGPLMYLVAYQYLKAGVPVRAILDTAESGNLWRALPHLPKAVGKLGELLKGQGWINQIKKSGTEIIKGVSSLEMVGGESVTAVEFLARGALQSIETDTVYLHQGVVPNVNLSMATGCKHVWDKTQLCWQAETDGGGRSSVESVFIAGDGGAIGGAVAAEQHGKIVALAVLSEIGKLDQATRDSLADKPNQILARELRFRPFLDTLFQPAKSMRIPEQAETIVCRCEETTAGQIHDAISLGCTGPNQLKSFTRCGMGRCQGRFCGLTVSEMIADQTGLSVDEVGYYRLRPPVKPVTLEQLASLDPALAAE